MLTQNYMTYKGIHAPSHFHSAPFSRSLPAFF